MNVTASGGWRRGRGRRSPQDLAEHSAGGPPRKRRPRRGGGGRSTGASAPLALPRPRPYSVVILPSTLLELVALPALREAIDALARDPRPTTARLLRAEGRRTWLRLRVNGARVIYWVDDGRAKVTVVKVNRHGASY